MGFFRFISVILSAATLTLLSCTKQEAVVEPVQEDVYVPEPVQFITYLGRPASTKAVAANPLGEGVSFNMKSYYNHDSQTERFYTCVKYSWNGTCFISSPVYYWPVNGTLDFYAVAPSVTHDAGTTILPDRTVEITALDGATDLMASSLIGGSRTDASHMLIFGHKLTKVVFKAVGADASLKYEITSLTLKVCPDATYSFADGDASESWTTASGTPKTYTYAVTAGTLDHGTEEAQALGAEGYGLMLLPVQPSAEGSVLLSVSYKATHKVGDGSEVTVHEGTHEVDLTKSATEGTSTWGINRLITYTLSLKPGDPIMFSADVGEWTELEINENL